jgi:hypothetical protein
MRCPAATALLTATLAAAWHAGPVERSTDHDDAWWSRAAAHRERGFSPVDWTVDLAELLSPESGPELVGVYLVGRRAGWESELAELERMLAEGRINCVVFDAKLAPGEVCFPLEIPAEPRPGLATYPPPRGSPADAPELSPEGLAWELGAVRTYYDLPGLVERLRGAGAYVIARVVVHYDRYLACYDPRGEARDWLAVKDDRTGAAWVGHADSVWVDPYAEGAWDYHLAVALACAEAGVDEVQFDYLRFPTEGDVLHAYTPHYGGRSKEWAVNAFLDRAEEVLRPTGVKLSVDVFGFSAFYERKNPEGQDVDAMALRLDALSPMNYPSHFGAGFYSGAGRTWRLLRDCAGILKGRLEEVAYVEPPPPDPRADATRTLVELAHPGMVHRRSPQAGFPGTRAACSNRPFLQAFDLLTPSDFTGYVRDQIRGALAGGADGYLFWHANSSYSPLWPALDPRWRPLPPPLNPLPKVEPVPEIPAGTR